MYGMNAVKWAAYGVLLTRLMNALEEEIQYDWFSGGIDLYKLLRSYSISTEVCWLPCIACKKE